MVATIQIEKNYKSSRRPIFRMLCIGPHLPISIQATEQIFSGQWPSSVKASLKPLKETEQQLDTLQRGVRCKIWKHSWIDISLTPFGLLDKQPTLG